MRLNASIKNLNREGGEATLEVLGSVLKTAMIKITTNRRFVRQFLKGLKSLRMTLLTHRQKVRASLHYLQYILTAIKFWYKIIREELIWAIVSICLRILKAKNSHDW